MLFFRYCKNFIIKFTKYFYLLFINYYFGLIFAFVRKVNQTQL